MLEISSPLSDETELRIRRVIGCCIEVHRGLGPGLLESIYSRAIAIELAAAGLSFERERLVTVMYRGQPLCHHRLDIVVAGEIVLEVKAVDALSPVHRAQLLSYLRVANLRVGLLVNFNVAVLREGLKRVVL
jgi:GxxExxY protein